MIEANILRKTMEIIMRTNFTKITTILALSLFTTLSTAEAQDSRSSYKAALLAAIDDMDICMNDINALLDIDLKDDNIVEDANFEKVYLSSEMCMDGFQREVQTNVPIVGQDDLVAAKMKTLQPKVIETYNRVSEVMKQNLRTNSRFR